MKDTNIVILTGRLGKDAEGRYTTAGKFVASFSIANNQGYTSNGEQVEETVWTDISVWGKLAEFANEKLKSGMLVLVEGTLKAPGAWISNKTNEAQASNRVTANPIKVLDWNDKGASKPGRQSTAARCHNWPTRLKPWRLPGSTTARAEN